MQNAQISNTVFASVAAAKPGIVPFAPGRSSAGQPHQGVARAAPPGRFADFLLRQPGVSNAPGTRTPEQPPPEIPALPPGSAALQQENSENAIAVPEPGYNLAAAVPDHHASAIAAATDTGPVLSGNPAETRPGRVPHAASLALIAGTPGENFEAAPARNAASQTNDLPRPVAAAAARAADPRDYAPPATPLADHAALAAAANKSDMAIADLRGNTSAMKSTALPAEGLSTPAIRLPETRQYPHHHRQTEAHGGHHPGRRADNDPAGTGVPPQARGPARRPGMPANGLPFHPATDPASLPPDSRPFPTSDAALSGSNKQAPPQAGTTGKAPALNLSDRKSVASVGENRKLATAATATLAKPGQHERKVVGKTPDHLRRLSPADVFAHSKYQAGKKIPPPDVETITLPGRRVRRSAARLKFCRVAVNRATGAEFRKARHGICR